MYVYIYIYIYICIYTNRYVFGRGDPGHRAAAVGGGAPRAFYFSLNNDQ